MRAPLRAGARIVALGAAAFGTAGRARGLPPDAAERARERARLLRDVSRRVLAVHGVEVELRGAIPLAPALLVSNHVSWLDPLVIAAQVPCAPVSKREVERWPFLGALARELGVIFVARGDARSGARTVSAAARAVAAGVAVLNFPEGTTTRGAAVLPFRRGLFRLAVAGNLPVVPIALAYDPPGQAWVGEDTFVPHYLALASRSRTRAVLAFGAPLPAGDDAAALAERARAAVAGLLQEPG